VPVLQNTVYSSKFMGFGERTKIANNQPRLPLISIQQQQCSLSKQSSDGLSPFFVLGRNDDEKQFKWTHNEKKKS
jgi:hypothetical protein